MSKAVWNKICNFPMPVSNFSLELPAVSRKLNKLNTHNEGRYVHYTRM
jgi:hypothetical protein